MIDVVRQAMPAADEIWEQLGRDRAPGRTGERLTVAFFGSAYPHKGPQLLVEAAQRSDAGPARARSTARSPSASPRACAPLDQRGVVELCGAFAPAALPELLAGVDVAVMPSHVVGLRAADGRRVPGRPRSAGRPAPRRPRRGDRRRGRRPVLRRPRRRRPRAPARPPGRRAGAARAPAGRDRGAARRSPPTSTSSRPTTPASARRVAALDTAATAVTLAGRPRPAHEPVAHQRRGHRAPRRRSSAWTRDRRADRRPAAARGRRRGPPPVAARPAPAALGPPGRDPALGVRRDPDATGSSRCSATSTSFGCPASSCARMYVDAGVEADRVHVVPNGVDLERFAPDGERLSAGRLAGRALPVRRRRHRPQGRRPPARRLARGVRRPRRRAAS